MAKAGTISSLTEACYVQVNGKFKCKSCDKQYPDMSRYNRHLRDTHLVSVDVEHKDRLWKYACAKKEPGTAYHTFQMEQGLLDMAVVVEEAEEEEEVDDELKAEDEVEAEGGEEELEEGDEESDLRGEDDDDDESEDLNESTPLPQILGTYT